MAKQALSSIANLHILLGPETGEKLTFTNELIKKAEKACGEIERYKFYPYDTDISSVVSLMRTPSLFGAGCFVILANVDIFKKADIDALLPALKTRRDDLYLVLLSDAYKLEKRLEDLCPKENKKIFWEMRDNDRERWLNTFFRKAGQTMAPDAVQRLLELLENNSQELKLAAEALSGFYSTEKIITEEMVDRLIVHGREETIFTLFERLALRDAEGAAETLNKMALSPDGIGVQSITGLTWQFRKLLGLKEHTAGGGTITDETLRNFAVIGKRNQQLYQQALRKYTLDELRTIMIECNRYDEILRSGLNREMQRIALDSFLLTCCTGSSAL